MTDEELQEFYESNKNAWIMTYKFGEVWSEIELKDFIRLVRTVKIDDDKTQKHPNYEIKEC